MSYIHAIVLGLIQGLTEFFPVSSSGHLILVPVVFRWPDQGVFVDALLHLGTLGALLVYFWGDLVGLARDFTRGSDGAKGRRLVFQLCVATLPALGAGYLLKDWIEQFARSGSLVAVNLFMWGIVLFLADRWNDRLHDHTSDVRDISWKQALLIGLLQPLALVPGTSRSGITITTGLVLGLRRDIAARFAFLLSIPTTFVAGGYSLFHVWKTGTGAGDGYPVLFVAGLVAFASGMYAMRFLVSYVQRSHYDAFVYYRLALAACVLLLV